MDFLSMGIGYSLGKNNAEVQNLLKQENDRVDRLIEGHANEQKQAEFRINLNQERSRTELESKRAESLEVSVNFYKNLLTKPMSEIAAYDHNFAKAYHIQQQAMTNWILSEKAFKDLSYDLGLSIGFSEQKVDGLYLERVNEIASGTNPNEKMPDSLQPYVERAGQNIHKVMDVKYSNAPELRPNSTFKLSK